MLRQYEQEIEKLKKLLDNRQSTPLKVEDVVDVNDNHNTNDQLNDINNMLEYRTEMEKLKNLHESERAEKESVLKQIELIKEEYKNNLERLKSDEMKPNEQTKTSKEDILNRIGELKASLIGGERANDKELSERRKKKKLASERRLRYTILIIKFAYYIRFVYIFFFSAIAHVLAKIDMNADREILQNQYKDITQELNLKTEALRRYRHKVYVRLMLMKETLSPVVF